MSETNYEIKELIVEAKTVEEAVSMGKKELGEDAEFEIISMPEKKFFGLKQTDAKVRVYKQVAVKAKKETAKVTEKPFNQTKPAKKEVVKKTVEIQEKSNDKEDIEIKKETVITPEKEYNEYVVKALEILKSVVKEMGVDKVDYKVSQQQEEAMIIIEGEEASFLIGHHGETMSALQYLLSLSINRKKENYYRIILNIENYREKREKTLEGFAIKTAKKVVATGRSQILEPMNPYERRIIHAAIQKVEGAVSSSVGEEPNRKVVIKSTNPRKPYNKNGRSGNGGYRGNNNGGKKPYNKNYSRPNNNYNNNNSNNIYNNSNNQAKPETQKTQQPQQSQQSKEKKSDVNFGSLYGKIDLD